MAYVALVPYHWVGFPSATGSPGGLAPVGDHRATGAMDPRPSQSVLQGASGQLQTRGEYFAKLAERLGRERHSAGADPLPLVGRRPWPNAFEGASDARGRQLAVCLPSQKPCHLRSAGTSNGTHARVSLGVATARKGAHLGCSGRRTHPGGIRSWVRRSTERRIATSR